MKTDAYNMTPLHHAACSGDEFVVALLLDFRADITAVDDLGRAPLVCAGTNTNEKVADVLLKRGALVNEVVYQGATMVLNFLSVVYPE